MAKTIQAHAYIKVYVTIKKKEARRKKKHEDRLDFHLNRVDCLFFFLLLSEQHKRSSSDRSIINIFPVRSG